MGVVGKHALNLEKGILPMREHQLERAFAARRRPDGRVSGDRRRGAQSDDCVHGPPIL